MPSQPYALRRPVTSSREFLPAMVALRYEHLGNRGGFKQATPLEGAATQVGFQKVAEFANRPKQPSIGCAIDEETVKRGVPVSGSAKDAPVHQEPSEYAHHTPGADVASGDILILEMVIRETRPVHVQHLQDMLLNVVPVPLA